MPTEILELYYSGSTDSDAGLDPWTWGGDLPRELRRYYDWRNPPILDIRVEDPPKHEFKYDTDRFNPFHIHKNHSTAIALLEECFSLKDLVMQFDLAILERQNSWDLSDKLDLLAGLEDQVLKDQANAISSAAIVRANKVTDGSWEFASDKPGSVETEDEAAALQLAARKRELQRAERKRLKEASATIGSVHHYIVVKRDRAKAKYLHRLTELSMVVEALKHGLNLVHYVEPPEKREIPQRDFQAAAAEYSARLGIKPELNHEKNESVESHSAESQQKSSIDIETDIKNYLWAVSILLQKIQNTRDDYMERVSLKRLAGSNWSKLITGKKGSFQLSSLYLSDPEKSVYEPGENGRLLGLSAEVILKGERIPWPHKPDPKYKTRTILRKHVGRVGMTTNFLFSLPIQPNNSKTELKVAKDVRLTSAANFRDASGMSHIASGPLMYGTKIVKNMRPFGEWYLKFSTEISTNQIEDIFLYLHIEAGR